MTKRRIPAQSPANRESELERSLEAKLASLSDLERAELVALIDARKGRTPPAEVKLVEKPGARPAIETSAGLLTALKLEKAFAASSLGPARVRLGELLGYLHAAGVVDDDQINAAIAFVDNMGPQDQAEALLLVQMYITHRASVRALALMETTELVANLQIYGNLAVKLLRTAQGQMETFARVRRGGEQVVRHIHVDNRGGGQAVIAENLEIGGAANGKVADQPHALRGAAAFGAALPGPDPTRDGVPGPSDAERPLQVARRQKSRSTDRE